MDIEKYVQTEISVSKSIEIKKTYNPKVSSGEYEVDCLDLKQNVFDPNKGSPPSSWTISLLERIEKYGDKDFIHIWTLKTPSLF